MEEPALRMAFPQYEVAPQNFIIGIQGSINEQQWRQQLTELRTNSHHYGRTRQYRNGWQRVLEAHTQ